MVHTERSLRRTARSFEKFLRRRGSFITVTENLKMHRLSELLARTLDHVNHQPDANQYLYDENDVTRRHRHVVRQDVLHGPYGTSQVNIDDLGWK